MRVKCVDNWMYEHLLKRNGIYKVIRETSDSYIIVVDRVGYVSVSKDKFIIEEDKMENILKVGDKVVCTDDGGMKFLEKDKVYTISELDMEYIYLLEIKSSFSFNSKLFKKFDGDKMEEIRVVRKLEDLHNLENGMGLKIEWDRNLKTIDVNFGKIKMMYWSERELKYCGLELVLEQVKSLGFKFEYKPLRTEQEVKKEILSLESLPFVEEEANYYVDYNSLIDKYLVVCDRVNGHGLYIYMSEGLAQKYADELNEIIGVGK